ncbi:MAG: Fimbrial protein [Proteobacteria bacterium]|nr:Fimbrial protein [Pseudomonadota bacterium]
MRLVSEKLKLAILAVAAIFPVSSMAAADSLAITVNGTVKENTCTLDSKSPVVTLADVSSREFNGTVNVEVGSVNVPIKFSNCGADFSKMTVKMSGTSDDAIPDTVFKNTGTAEGVGVRFYDLDGRPFKPDGSLAASLANKFKEADGTISVNYTAKYVSTSTNIKSGSVSTVINAVFTYQ